MKQLLVAILCIAIGSFSVSAGEKIKNFSGTITHYDEGYRSLTVHNGKKEMVFFVIGSIIREGNPIAMGDLREGSSVTITYKKSKYRLIANKVDVKESVAVNEDP